MTMTSPSSATPPFLLLLRPRPPLFPPIYSSRPTTRRPGSPSSCPFPASRSTRRPGWRQTRRGRRCLPDRRCSYQVRFFLSFSPYGLFLKGLDEGKEAGGPREKAKRNLYLFFSVSISFQKTKSEGTHSCTRRAGRRPRSAPRRSGRSRGGWSSRSRSLFSPSSSHH